MGKTCIYKKETAPVVYFNYIFIKTYLTQKKNIQIVNRETLNKETIEETLNEIFSTDVDQNKQEIETFRK